IVVDEIATPREVTRGSEVAPVTLGAVAGAAAFVPYADKRWEPEDVAGTLGLGFFAGHAVWASWHGRSLHLVGRRPIDPAIRIARWDSAVLAKCPNLGCIGFRIVDPLGGKAPEAGKPHPGLVLSITRDEIAGGMGLEVVLEVAGDPAQPYQIVN